MSRFQVPSIDPEREVFVGWDEPLRTFFGQVYRTVEEDSEEDPIVHWVGAARACELPEIADLVEAMAGHAKLSDETKRRLFQDREMRR